MDLSLFLAKLFGIYFVIVGIVCLFNKSAMRELIQGLKANHVLLLLIALAEIAAGLSLVLVHSIFSTDYRVIITIIGYWTVVEGLIYLTLSKKSLKKLFNWFNHPGWFIGGGLLSIIMGAYLIVVGFGWWM